MHISVQQQNFTLTKIDSFTVMLPCLFCTGGMQDYNYIGHGIFEITLEVSCCKFPNASDLAYFWDENKDALINFLLEINLSKTDQAQQNPGNLPSAAILQTTLS